MSHFRNSSNLLNCQLVLTAEEAALYGERQPLVVQVAEEIGVKRTVLVAQQLLQTSEEVGGLLITELLFAQHLLDTGGDGRL